jgi:crotonobetainyl-CoA:carnitine CoA-transferase CaiB-like acyl-CoA transferase
VELLDTYVGEWIRQRTREEVLDAFTRAGAAIGPVYNARDIVEDVHVRETEMLVEVDDDDLGPLLQHNMMWRLTGSPGRIRFTGRALGQDTDAVLDELGYDEESIARLRKNEVIR